MAILSKIRERSMFLIVIISLALIALVASPKDILDFFNSSKVNAVGSVNGETISRRDFAVQVEAYKSNAKSSVSDMQAVTAVWKRILSEKIYKKQLDEAGIVIGEKDVWDAVIEIPSIKNAPLFQNELGLFDEEKLKEYLANLKENAAEQSDAAWLNWLETEKSVKSNLEKQAYTQLVKLGISASLAAGEQSYLEAQTKMSGSFVLVPYSSVADSLVPVSSAEVADYLQAHSDEFSEEASRDINYVKFDIKASQEDEADLKNELTYLSASFKATANAANFLADNDADLPLDTKYVFKSNLPTVVEDAVFNAAEGTVVGPYKFQNHYRLSKVVDFINMPDSVSASHILVTYAGSRAADASVTRTEAAAKKLADSILSVVVKKSNQFSKLAKSYSADKSNANKGGDLGWFAYGQMVPEFRDFTFLNKKGKIGVVQTVFGYHVIKITGQKNIQKAVQLATYGRKIEASETTENAIFEDAETLAYELSSGKNISELSKENNYLLRTLSGIKAMEEDVAVLGKNRSIVRWAFDKETAVNSSKRFDLEKGYAVVVLTNKTDKGLVAPSKAAAKVKPILIKEKKAALIASQMNEESLASLAEVFKTSVRSFSNVSMSAPTISGVGTEPAVVGAIFAVPTNTTVKNIVGVKGVFAISVANKELPASLPSYEASKNVLTRSYQNKANGQMYKALESFSEIVDDRSNLY
ncbi:peptidylprolyl isomerase [Flavicella sp.]|nr:peptidylprolyl isomerase [Flavicella sp.]